MTKQIIEVYAENDEKLFEIRYDGTVTGAWAALDEIKERMGDEEYYTVEVE